MITYGGDEIVRTVDVGIVEDLASVGHLSLHSVDNVKVSDL